jgi:hypothetical protein
MLHHQTLLRCGEHVIDPSALDNKGHRSLVQSKATELSLLPKPVLGDGGVEVEALLEYRFTAMRLREKCLTYKSSCYFLHLRPTACRGFSKFLPSE